MAFTFDSSSVSAVAYDAMLCSVCDFIVQRQSPLFSYGIKGEKIKIPHNLIKKSKHDHRRIRKMRRGNLSYINYILHPFLGDIL